MHVGDVVVAGGEVDHHVVAGSRVELVELDLARQCGDQWRAAGGADVGALVAAGAAEALPELVRPADRVGGGRDRGPRQDEELVRRALGLVAGGVDDVGAAGDGALGDDRGGGAFGALRRGDRQRPGGAAEDDLADLFHRHPADLDDRARGRLVGVDALLQAGDVGEGQRALGAEPAGLDRGAGGAHGQQRARGECQCDGSRSNPNKLRAQTQDDLSFSGLRG